MGRGLRVRAVARHGATGLPAAVETVVADVADPAAARRAMAGADVVYHTASAPYDRWPELLPPLMRGVIAGAATAGARIVYADNLYAYGPVDGPLREDLPEVATGRKGRTRVEVAAELREAHAAGRARVTIARASDYFGPGGLSSVAGESAFGRTVGGGRPIWPGRLDQPHSFQFLPDLARALIVLAERPEADGETWHVPAGEPLTAQAFFDLAFAAAGRPTPARVQAASPVLLAVAALFSPLLRELRETSYQVRAPFVADSSKFERDFGPFRSTPHPEAIEQTVRWFEGRRAAGRERH
ncbi:MAG: NAD-dependent epimerase/dehydratase family protein [Thermoleophilaceae bacterium]